MFCLEQRALVREQERLDWLREAERERLAHEAQAAQENLRGSGLLDSLANALRKLW